MTPAPSRRNAPRVSLERALSKLGFASRTAARALILKGRVQVNGSTVTDPALRVDPARARIAVDGEAVRAADRVYVALHKPRGLVTTLRDEHGRDTVYDCFHGAGLPPLVPVGRLDKDSEGLLLFTNDTRWAQRVLEPAKRVEKRYEVHVSGPVDETLLAGLREGVHTRRGDVLRAVSARVLRAGPAGAVLELVLDEGRNRHIRRMLEAVGLEVKRLLRSSVGPVRLGKLEPARWRHLTEAELAAFGELAPPSRDRGHTERGTP
ncbi:MAG TPA: pseudouridine synthase [Longimicrobiales bacterium]|nr:pseudouridine synthase [Longimicrobiales bacterium]